MQRSPVSTLLTVQKLKQLISSGPPCQRVLDASWHLPNTGRNARVEYEEQHIPGALFFDIDGCADKSTDLPHMIPSPKVFEEYVGSLGISNNTHVIVYDNNPQFPLFSAQRVWWTFRLFGHNNISLLEGGLPKWIAEGGQVTKDVPLVPKETFNAEFKQSLVKTYDDLVKNIEQPIFTVIDARPDGRFKGIAPEPREDTKSGCITQTLNVPFMSTMNVEERTMKSPDELKALFKNAGVDLTKPLVASCGSGISACILALAAHLCNQDNVAIYDGSWTEWYKKAPAHLKKNVPE